jgi:poly(3-hydroxybutyrate) depolymerase
MMLTFPMRSGYWHRLVLGVFKLLVLAPALLADGAGTGFLDRVYHDEAGAHKYTVFIPAAYRADQKWPVLLFLHGAGSRGTDGKLPLICGIGAQIEARAKTLPMIVVFPQCEDVDGRASLGWRAEGPDAKRALAILDEVERDFSVDRKREILAGTSMGGFGTWNIAAVTPERWSAIVPVAGFGDVSKVRNFKNVPIWAFHGSKDLEVKPADHKRMVDAVRDIGGRAYFTLLPEVRHNILNVVFSDDAVYEWMLNPTSLPRQESIVQSVKRPFHNSKVQSSFLPPFVPGAEIPQAVYLHVDPETIEAITYALPDLVPAGALAAAAPNVYQSRRGAMTRFHITLAGINYRGALDRVVVTPKDNGWITITLGLRNLVAEVGSTQIRSRLVSASAGPMEIVIGQAHPVWLAFDVRPTVADKKIKFEVGERHFAIPNDDYYVTAPQVATRGVPLFRNRIANTVSSKLVEGAYERKTEIEQKVIDAVPGLVQRLETELEESLARTREVGGWPMPALQPRYRLWVDSLKVDRSGIAIMLGAVFAQPGLNPTPRPVVRIERELVKLDEVAPGRGLVVGFSGGVLEGLSKAIVDSGAAVMNANDMSVREFSAFGEVEEIAKVVPDLSRYGNRLQLRTQFRAVEPVLCKVLRESDVANGAEAGDKSHDQRSKCLVEMGLPHVVVSVEIKTSPKQAKWQEVAQFNLSIIQAFKLSVREPTFSERTFQLKRVSTEKLVINGRFADGYSPEDPALHPDALADIFRTAWNAAGKLDLVDEGAMKDRLVGTANLRANELGTIGPFITLRYLPARTRITNGTPEPIVYEVRGPQTGWGGPFQLEPGQSSDFPVPYPVTLRRSVLHREEVQTLPMGAHFVFEGLKQDIDPTNIAGGTAKASRN